MRKRLFIALNLADDAKDGIENVLRGLPLPKQAAVRVTPRENWHITVIFLGDQETDEIPKIESAITEAVRKRNAPPPGGKLQQISYGPPGPRPRMIWARLTRDASDGIGYLQKLLMKKLADEGINWQHEDYGHFDGHITLARFNPTPLRSLPHLQKPLNFGFRTPTLDLMSSELGRNGPKYTVVAKIAF